jgi:putative endonuclease
MVICCHSRRESAFVFVVALLFLLSFPKEISLRQNPHTKESKFMRKRQYQFWVYILSNRSHILYIGVTSNLPKRLAEHRKQAPGSFTARYKITRLVYFEHFQYINNALTREKELKHWTRAQKIALIEASNPTWQELLPESDTPLGEFHTQIPFGNDKPEE